MLGGILSIVGSVAPRLGSMLKGPLGKAATGMLADKLGVENDEKSIERALMENPEALARVKEAEAELEKAELEAQSAREEREVEDRRIINKTMQAELDSDGWFKSGWRPAIGWILAFSLGGIAGALIYAIIRTPTILSDPNFSSVMIWLFGVMGAALGINVKKRSDDKQVKAGIKPQGILDKVLNRK